MTTWTEKKCDKCGQRSDGDSRGWASGVFRARHAPLGIDFCPPCWDEIEAFIKKPKEVAA